MLSRAWQLLPIVAVLCGCSHPRTLAGTWEAETVPAGKPATFIEFRNDGKWNLTMPVMIGMARVDGSYSLKGNRLVVTVGQRGPTATGTFSLHWISADEFSLSAEKGQPKSLTGKFKRI